MYVGFAAPAAYTDPVAAVLTKLFARLLTDGLNEVAYAATLAGCSTPNPTPRLIPFCLSHPGPTHTTLPTPISPVTRHSHPHTMLLVDQVAKLRTRKAGFFWISRQYGSDSLWAA